MFIALLFNCQRYCGANFMPQSVVDFMSYLLLAALLLSVYIIVSIVNLWILLVMMWLLFDYFVGYYIWRQEILNDWQTKQPRKTTKKFRLINGGK